MPHPKRSVDDRGGERSGESSTSEPLHVAHSTPAQQVDPASYHSFIELKTFQHDTGRSSHAQKHSHARRPLQVADRPFSFLDLDESDARIPDRPPQIPNLPFENADDARVVSLIPLSLTTSNCEKGQGKPGVMTTSGPESSPCDPISIDGSSWRATPFRRRNAPQSCDLFSCIVPPYSLHASLCLVRDQLPSYEEVAGSAPVDLEENAEQQFASNYPESSYHVDPAKAVLLPSSQDPTSAPCNTVVVLPTRPVQRTRRPLPPIPPSEQTHVMFTTPLDTREQPLHVDELNVVPAKPLSQMERTLLQRMEFEPNIDHSMVPLA